MARCERPAAISLKPGGMERTFLPWKAARRGGDPHGGVTSAAEFDDEAYIRSAMRHRESTEFAREYRWALQPITTRPREPQRDVGRVVHVGARIGSVAQGHGAAPDLPRPASGARATSVEQDPGAGAWDAEPAGAVEQHASRVGLKTSGRLRQCRPVSTTGENRECADQQDPHGGTIARDASELRRLAQGDRIMIPRFRYVTFVRSRRGRAGAIELVTGS